MIRPRVYCGDKPAACAVCGRSIPIGSAIWSDDAEWQREHLVAIACSRSCADRLDVDGKPGRDASDNAGNR